MYIIFIIPEITELVTESKRLSVFAVGSRLEVTRRSRQILLINGDNYIWIVALHIVTKRSVLSYRRVAPVIH